MEKIYEKSGENFIEKQEKQISREDIEARIAGYKKDLERLDNDKVIIQAEIDKLEEVLK